ncbi:MAG: sodium:solute symporter [Elusimicrobia bacterium CG03_land_8_20_14_0_80_50_18]|nr:MAG: sodium:solute symporter [Elusimicrobia bacterium CG03_land_8_20_14_0_80_50_18]
MTIEMLFMATGGLGFFFFGMELLSDGLKKVSGEKLKSFLHSATKVPVIGVIAGATVTCLIQSSSATSVMTVGFVNAGLLSLRQAIPVIMGANIGTTFTAWLVSSMSVFKVTDYSLPAIGIGFLLTKAGKTRRSRSAGQVILGFGLLFTGLSFMKDAFIPLKNSSATIRIFAELGQKPVLGVMVGIIFTVLLQSSSATIAIVQMLAFNGVLSFPAAIAIVLGDNVGTTITAQMAAVNTTIAAKRTAMAHSMFNVLGTAYMMIFLHTGIYENAVYLLVPGEISSANIMLHIAVAHSLFNVVNTMVFLPLTEWLEKISVLLVPEKEGAVKVGTQYLEKHLLETPGIALELVKKETVYMLSLAAESVSLAFESFIKNDLSNVKKTAKLEDAVDNLQSEITQYIVELSGKGLSEDKTGQLPVLIHIVNDIERIGDYSENIVELAERKIEEKLPLTARALTALNLMWAELNVMMIETGDLMAGRNNSTAEKILAHEEKINRFQADLKKGHVDRLNRRECNLKSSVVFLDLVDNLEKIGDHLSNIAQGIAGGMIWRDRKHQSPDRP